jgi:hypothetical protein
MAAGMAADEITELRHELARRLNERGISSTIRVVGGAALVARDYRTTTTFDIDAVFQPEDAVLEVAAEIAAERNLPSDWLNSDAKAYVPFVAPGQWRHLFCLPHPQCRKCTADIRDVLPAGSPQRRCRHPH